MYGRHFDHNDRLVSQISRRSINALKEFFAKELKPEDIKVLLVFLFFFLFSCYLSFLNFLSIFAFAFESSLTNTSPPQLLIKLKKTFQIE